MRIVLDTNNLISALIGHPLGPSARLVRAWKNRRIILISSQAQLDEIRDVLTRPRIQKRTTPQEAAIFVEGLPLLAEMVVPTPGIDLSPDPKDNFVIGMAVAGKADLLVSGDHADLVKLGTAAGVEIVTAREALNRLGEDEAT